MQRFWSKVDIQKRDECWIWLANCYSNGYGQFKYLRKPHLAHRVSWTLCNGPIPSELGVLHKCDNRPCVNPTHLFLGTQKDNIQDMINKGRAPSQQGIKNPSAKLTERQVLEIRKLQTQGESLQCIADYYLVSRGSISYIVNRKTWQHVKENNHAKN